MNAAASLFDSVVEASGLIELIAPFAVSRMLVAAGVSSPRELTPEDLATALPKLEEGLGAYLRGEDLEAAMTDLRRLAA